MSEAQIGRLLPNIPELLLEGNEQLIHGELVIDDPTLYYCDADNYEMLLRFQRAAQRPQVQTRNVRDLPGFIARWQGFGRPCNEQNLLESLEQLRGYAAPARVWLKDLLCARFHDFTDHLLDAALVHNEIHWLGVGKETLTLGYPEDLQLVRQEPDQASRPSDLAQLFADPAARYGFTQLADASEVSLEQFNEIWWQAVWNGEISADSLAPLRQGLQRKFGLASLKFFTAGGSSVDLHIDGLTSQRAEQLRESILQRSANTAQHS